MRLKRIIGAYNILSSVLLGGCTFSRGCIRVCKGVYKGVCKGVYKGVCKGVYKGVASALIRAEQRVKIQRKWGMGETGERGTGWMESRISQAGSVRVMEWMGSIRNSRNGWRMEDGGWRMEWMEWMEDGGWRMEWMEDGGWSGWRRGRSLHYPNSH